MTNRNVGLSAGGAVAVLALVAGQALARPTPCGNPQGPDVIVGVIQGIQNYTAVGTLEAISLGTTSCNVGNVNLQWNANPANTHPVIGGNLYRYQTVNGAGRFEQVGQSWLKHAFTALTNNDCCTCNGQGGTVLGVGCSDPYTASRNGSQSGMGPRYQVNAHTGFYPTGSPPRPSGGNTGRLEVDVSDLVATTGGTAAAVRYVGECQYVTPDDATTGHQDNNASSIEITTSGTGSVWNFALLGSTQREKSAIEWWKTIDSAVQQTTVIVPGDGKFMVVSKATAIAGGMWHYEYAVYNMNSDRNGGVFSIPISDVATVANVGFHGVVYRGGDGNGGVNFSSTPWTSTRSAGTLSWSTQTMSDSTNANAIRWGTMYNFRFDSNTAPAGAIGSATLGLWKPGTPTSVAVGVQIPGIPPCIADRNADSGVTVDDLLSYLGDYQAGSIAADIDNGSGANTHDGGVTIEDLLYYLVRYDAGC